MSSELGEWRVAELDWNVNHVDPDTPADRRSGRRHPRGRGQGESPKPPPAAATAPAELPPAAMPPAPAPRRQPQAAPAAKHLPQPRRQSPLRQPKRLRRETRRPRKRASCTTCCTAGAMGYMIDGGIFMWPILLLGILALGVIIERYRTLMMLNTQGRSRCEPKSAACWKPIASKRPWTCATASKARCRRSSAPACAST